MTFTRSFFILLCAVAVAGCTRTLDKATLESHISQEINKQLALPIKTVSCPADRPIQAGDTFQCTATPEPGGLLTVDVKQQDDEGNVNWTVSKTEGLLDLQAAESSIRNGLKDQAGVDAKVSCGSRWRATTPGETFECKAVTSEEELIVAVTTKDADGNISWEVQ